MLISCCRLSAASNSCTTNDPHTMHKTATFSRSMSVISNHENLKQQFHSNNWHTTEDSQIKIQNVILHNTNSGLQCTVCLEVRHNFQQQVAHFYWNISGICRTFYYIMWHTVKWVCHDQYFVHSQVTHWWADSLHTGEAAESTMNKQSQTVNKGWNCSFRVA